MRSKKMLLAFMALAAFAFAAVPAIASAATPSLTGVSFPLTFTSTSGEGTLFAEGVAKVSCKSDTNEGEFTSSTTGTGTVTFHECTSLGTKCTTPGQPKGTIKTNELSVHLVYLAGGAPGILFKPGESGVFTTFECAGGLVHIQVEGSGVLGGVTEPAIGGSSTMSTITVNGTSTSQEYTETSEGEKFGLQATINGGSAVPAYENSGEDTVTFAEEATTSK